jgi:hypothetical protein
LPNATAKAESADKTKAASASQVADDDAAIAQAAAEAKAAADAKSAAEWKAKAEAASFEVDGLRMFVHDLLQKQRDQIEHLEAALQSKGNALEHSAG